MAAGQTPEVPPDPTSIVPYVPRLTIEWLRDEPERLWREVDGTLAFVDVSGFTAMSERLARRGKVGAEEVTEVMNGVFAALLQDAYAYGGGLLKFGGDALLLLYDGEGHAARAARAAHQMRRTLRALGRPRTSAGTVTLRMHVGIHSGLLHFFLVGDSHRELLVAGPDASRTVEMEAASEAGEILVSPETAALLERAALGDAKEAGVLLRAAPQAGKRSAPLPDVSAVALADAVPSRLRAELTLGPLEGEHRHAAIGFIRFSGTDAVIASDGPAAAAEALHELVRIVQRAADAHGVTFLESDIDRNGGRIVLVAGAPQTAGDDEERLLRTLRAVVEAAPPLPLHAGASRGRVFAGQVGAPFRRTYTILGDTAALAARLMARAGENEILVAADVLERSDARFEARELEPFRVKGKSEPVRAAALGPLLESAAARPTQKLPFVDRERERAVLGASVAPVRMGFGTLVELIGEPGIGKSRLAEELRDQCTDMATFTASCDQYASTTPYHPFRSLLRSLLQVELDGDAAANSLALATRLRELDPELEPWAPLLGAPLDVEVESTPEVDELDPAFRRARLHGVVAAALERLLDSPTLLFVEDVHWMDEPSSELFRHIGTQLPTRPWLACTTRRPVSGGFVAAEGTPPLPAFTLRLEPLPAADAKALIEAAAGDRALREDELAAIAERGGGNPLFLQELASAEEPAAEREELPENVEALVASRIDRLAPPDRTLLRWASVLGTTFAGTLIADVLAGDPSAASDSEAWDRLVEFIERDPDIPGGFRFRHALIRDAAYEGLPYRRRRELHARVADVVEAQCGARSEDEAELLSLHFHRAGRSAEAWRYSVAAGRRAQDKWANVEAAEFYRRALDVSSEIARVSPWEVAAVWEALGDCLQLSGEFGEAARAFGAARRLTAKDAPAQVVLLRKEGALRELMGKYSEALRWYGRGLKAATHLADEDARTKHRLRFTLLSAQVRFRQGAFGECMRLCGEVVDAANAAGDTEALASAYQTLHVVHTLLGSPERRAFRGLALPLYEELGDLSGQAAVLGSLGAEAYYEGDWVKALDLYERSRALRERLGDVTKMAMQLNNIGEVRSDQGHLEEAEQMFREVQRICDTAGRRDLATIARSNLGRAAARAGRFDEAEELLEEALASFRELHAASFVLETEARLAELAWLRGDRPQEALAHADSVLDRADDAAGMAAVQAAALRLRAAARLQLREADAAGNDLAESLRIAHDAEALYEIALALDLSAAAAGDADAAAQSAALFERLGVERVARPTLEG
jgi:class 3 adenylate cyclase/tetratricopeptide (TPR) repeat protein